MQLGPSEYPIPPKPLTPQQLLDKLMKGETLTTQELMQLQKLGDSFEEE
jgi:hypothetical protein